MKIMFSSWCTKFELISWRHYICDVEVNGIQLCLKALTCGLTDFIFHLCTLLFIQQGIQVFLHFKCLYHCFQYFFFPCCIESSNVVIRKCFKDMWQRQDILQFIGAVCKNFSLKQFVLKISTECEKKKRFDVMLWSSSFSKTRCFQ